LSIKSKQPFQINTLQDENYRTEGDAEKDKITNEHAYEYDLNGNLVYINTSRVKQDGIENSGSGEKKYLWDEENRLLAVNINGFISSYWYDAGGEREAEDYEHNHNESINIKREKDKVIITWGE
jgi:YD repeat-containing protein